MKKALKIVGITLVAIVLILLILPFAFKGKIKDIVINEGNKMLNAEFYFESVSVSFIRNFPNLSVTINDFYIHGVEEFEKDTLASADKILATVSLSSLFSDDGYEISRVAINDADVKAVVLENGKVNWDVMKPDTEDAEDDDDGEDSDLRLVFKNITLDNVNVAYDDRQGGIGMDLRKLELQCSGDMTADRTKLKVKAATESLTVNMGGVSYLKNSQIKLKSDIDAYLSDMRFVFEDNEFAVNAIRGSIEGEVAMDDTGYDMDIKLNTEKVQFKDILSMIPAIYAKDFDGLKADGEVRLAAWAKGRMDDNNMPAFDASIDVKNASFQYPSLPQGVSNIQLAASIKNPGGSADKTIVDVRPLSFNMAGNPFSLDMHLETPVSDPAFDVNAKGVINLGKIKDVYPLDGTELNGLLDANVGIKGRMSYVDRNQYDKITATGNLSITDMIVKMTDMPDVKINKSKFTFTPKYLELSQTNILVGRSDITTDCRLEGYLGYVFRDEMITGQLNITSKLIDLNELMGVSAEESAQDESAPMSAFEVPKNVNFNMNTNIQKVLFGNFTLEQVKGNVAIAGGKLDMRNLSFRTMGGNILANGYYSTAAGVQEPVMNAGFAMTNVSFAEAYRSLDMVKKMAPIFENLKGSFSGSINVNTKLDQQMSAQLNTLNAHGGLSTSNLNLSGVKAIDALASAVKYDKMKNVNVGPTKVDFSIKDGRVYLKPFDLKMADAKLNLSGNTGLDKTIAYKGTVALPANATLGGRLTNVTFNIGGTATDPKVSIDTKAIANEVIEKVKDEVVDKISDKIGIDLTDAQAQKDALVKEARAAGDKVVAEAQKQVDALMAKAGNDPIKKLAAQKAGDKIMQEARQQSDQMVAKATAEGDKIIDKAKLGK